MKSYKIKSIKYIGRRKTFDLQVEDNDNFFLSNGILSHNSGKSVGGKTIIEAYHDNRGYKIWDIYGGERQEGIYWTIPSQDKQYWDKIKLVGTFDEDGPKQYKVNLLYPYFESKLPPKLPFKQGYVSSKLFTIPLKDVIVEDIKMVIGTMSDTSAYVWNEIVNKVTKHDTCSVLEDLSKKFEGTSAKSLLVYKSFILPMFREKFLMNYDVSTNLDLKSEADDQEAITVLCLDFVPQQYHLFVINYLLRKMAELIDENKIKKKNLIFIREAATFFRATDESVADEKMKIFRAQLSNYLRYGRRGQSYVLDTQAFSECRGLVSGAEDFLLMFRTQSFRDREEMCEQYRREKRMRPDQINDLAFLEKGECYIIEQGNRNVMKTKLILPRSCYWKKEYPNFYKSFWEKFGGDWKNTNSVIEEIDTIYDENKDKYKNEVKEVLESLKPKKNGDKNGNGNGISEEIEEVEDKLEVKLEIKEKEKQERMKETPKRVYQPLSRFNKPIEN